MSGGSDALLTQFENLLDKKLIAHPDSIKATKKDVQLIMGELNSLKEENKGLKLELEWINLENEIIKSKLSSLEDTSCQNNFIFKQIKHDRNLDLFKVVEFCSSVFGMSEDTWVSRVHTLEA